MGKEHIRGERRNQRRYPLELELSYKVIDDGAVVGTGAGKTENLSSGGLLFQTAGAMSDGPVVELSIRWPAVLGNAPFIELCIFGRVIRRDANGTAVRMSRYHFQRLANVHTEFEHLFGKAMIQ